MSGAASATVPAAAVRRPDFTILLPIIRPPVTLAHALGTALRQTVEDIEVIILCDGAPPETVAEAERLAGSDRRVRAAAFPKGARNGEMHRARIVGETTGRNLAQIADDDLWFPDHLATLRRALDRADFAHTCLTLAMPDGGLKAAPWGHLRDPKTRNRMLSENFSFFGPTECAYRRTAYETLPDGWTPAPLDVFSDLHMWRKFVSLRSLRLETVMIPTSFKFPAWRWRHEPPEAADAALRGYAERLRTPEGAADLRRRALGQLARDRTWEEHKRILGLDPRAAVRLMPRKLTDAASRRLGATALDH